MNYIDKIKVNQTDYIAGLPNINISDKGNLNIETSAEIGNCLKPDGSAGKGKINIESMDDIQIKPGDDVIFYSHHRPEGNQDEVSVKFTDGDDIPVKLQVNAAEMTLTTKDKAGTDADVMNITVNSAKNTRGYLKVRAQAIDLRSESHGGIALQPKGKDSDGHMNKIKFEHGGGDGLEFGTFNTEKASLFTDEYRFNKDGIWKMATRVKTTSDKADVADDTTHFKYIKQADDFYDVINEGDVQADTESIIKTANAFNYGKNRHAKMTSKGNLELETCKTYQWVENTTNLNVAFLDSAQQVSVINLLVAETGASEAPTEVRKALDDVLKGQSQSIIRVGDNAYTLKLQKDPTAANKDHVVYITYSDQSIKYVVFDGSQFSLNESALTTKYLTIDFEQLPDMDVTHIYNSGDFNSTHPMWDQTKTYNINGKYYKLATIKSPKIKIVSDNNIELESATDVVITIGEDECLMSDVIKLIEYFKTEEAGPWNPEYNS